MNSLYEETKQKNNILQKSLYDLGQDYQSYNKYMYSMIPKTELDLMFIVDCTGSMSSWIEAVKVQIFSIVKQIKSQFKTSCIRVCFTGYRDLGDTKERFSVFPFSTNWRQFKKFVSSVRASGGADTPEDVFGGFKTALEQNWASGARYAVFIADAPGHGTIYHDVDDSYPKGDPSGLDLEHFMKEFADKKIKLYSARINDINDKMMRMLSAEYKKYTKNEIGIGELGQSVKGFSSFIVNTALDTINKIQEEEGVEKVDNTKLYYRVVQQMRQNTEYCKSNKIFTGRYNDLLSQIKSLLDENNKRDEDFETNSFILQEQNSTENNTKELNVIKHEITIKKEEGYTNFIRWDEPLQFTSIPTNVNIQLSNNPFAQGGNNYVFMINESGTKRVGRIPIRVKRTESQNLQYYENLFKDMIIAQNLFGNNTGFCIYEVEIDNRKVFLASELYQQDLTKYDYEDNFQPITYDDEGLYKQTLCHQSYQDTLGQYIIVNYSHPPKMTDQIYKPLVYSLNPASLPNMKNQSYIGIFKFFLNHSCNEKCTDEKELIDLEDYTDPEKLNFKIPEPDIDE